MQEWQGLPKTHIDYINIPTFRPIIETTGSSHCNLGKFISNLLNPLTHNKFALKDTFDAVNIINTIPTHLFNDGYQLLSFDLTSLFTNVPLTKTINIITKTINIILITRNYSAQISRKIPGVN